MNLDRLLPSRAAARRTWTVSSSDKVMVMFFMGGPRMRRPAWRPTVRSGAGIANGFLVAEA
ncbi:MAG: hypothetical protein B7Y61_20250, partial [Rhizobiales bacterium 35-66-30]